MDKTINQKMRLRHLLLYEFRLGHTAADAYRNICYAEGEDAISRTNCFNWFNRFKNNNFSLEDENRPGRPLTIERLPIKEAVEANPYLSLRCLGDMFNCSFKQVDNILYEIGKVAKLGRWVPHALSKGDMERRVQTCLALLSRRRHFHWLQDIITGDETWVLYVNHSRKKQWIDADETPAKVPKVDLYPRKVMLCIWWDSEGVIYYELLPDNTTVNSDLYCQQLNNLACALKQKRPFKDNILFLHDNARAHTAKKTSQKLLQLGWEVISHPPYSPDISPSDYYLFKILKQHLREKSFNDRGHLKEELDDFFSSKSTEFYSHGIQMLPDRWRDIVNKEGGYIND